MVQADEELLRRARERATDRGISIAQLVREAIERELGSDGDRGFSIVGKYASGGDGSSARELTESPDAIPPVGWPSS